MSNPFQFHYRGIQCIPLQVGEILYWTATIVNGDHRIPILANSTIDIRKHIDQVLDRIGN